MIHFYSLSQEEASKFLQVMNNVEGVVSIVLANMLNNNPKYKIEETCNLHPNDMNEVGVIYTGGKIEYIITQYCCDDFKIDIDIEIARLQRVLNPSFEG